MTSAGFEAQLVHYSHYAVYSLYHLTVVGRLPQLLHLNLFSLACVINILHISSHKMTSVRFEPQWFITEPVVFTTRPLSRCWKSMATYSP
jgi:hypothetical protein